jgi:hypothetical protein
MAARSAQLTLPFLAGLAADAAAPPPRCRAPGRFGRVELASTFPEACRLIPSPAVACMRWYEHFSSTEKEEAAYIYIHCGCGR